MYADFSLSLHLSMYFFSLCIGMRKAIKIVIFRRIFLGGKLNALPGL